MQTDVILYINKIKIPIAPVEIEYGISSGETTQIATISPPTSATGSNKGYTYVYRDLGERYVDLTFNIRTNDKNWDNVHSTVMKTDTDLLNHKSVKNEDDIINAQDFIDWMMHAHGTGEPLKVTINKFTQYSLNKNYTHTLTGTYKVSRTSISTSADKLYYYATFSLGLVRYMPPVMERVKMVSLAGDASNVSVNSAAVESYEPVQTTAGFRASNPNSVYSGSGSGSGNRLTAYSGSSSQLTANVRGLSFGNLASYTDSSEPSGLERVKLELTTMKWYVFDEQDTKDYFKQLCEDTVARALTSVSEESSKLLYNTFIENPIELYNRENLLAPLKTLGKDFLKILMKGVSITWDGARTAIISAAGLVNPVLKLGVEATFNLTGALVSKIPLPSVFSEGVDASAETPLLGDGGIVLSSYTDLGFDPKLHATGFEPETISPAYRIMKPGIYKKEL